MGLWVGGVEGFGRRKQNEHDAKLMHQRELTFRPMRKMKACAFLVSWLCLIQSQAQLACGADSTLIGVVVTTDGYGGELYWELVPIDGTCGDGSALFWGGDPQGACGEAVDGLDSEEGAYENNAVIQTEGLCVSSSDSLVLVHRDDYGDGGTQFLVTFDGGEALQFQGTGSGNEWAFLPAFAAGDTPCLASAIGVDSNAVASLSGLTVSSGEPAPPALGCGTYGGWCESGLSNTLWLSWEVPVEGGVYLISTCNEGTTFDTQLALWEASDCNDFNSFALLNANDDAGCGLGSFRSTMLTPCLQGGETLYLQIDGYYGEVGDVEVSIQAAPLNSWEVNVSVDDLSCSLQQSFNPDGTIVANTNVGPEAVDWSWSGPFGFVSDDPSLGPLLPGSYELEASFCGQTFEGEYMVEEPSPLEFEVFLVPDCAGGAMAAELGWEGGAEGAVVTWTSGGDVFEGFDVGGLQEGICEVELTDANGCVSSDMFWVEAVGVPDVDLGPDLFGCAGDAFTLLAPLQANLSYQWSTGQTGALLVLDAEDPGTLVVGVEVTDDAGCTASDAVILTLDDCTSSIEQAAPQSAFNVYPNPFVDKVTVTTSSESGLSNLRLIDAQGRCVPCDWTGFGGHMTADLTHLSAGMYLLRCDESQQVVRLTKPRQD